MKQYKTCNGCKALTHCNRSKIGGMKCGLGFSTEDAKIIMGVVVETKPTEPCLKPKTNSDYIYFHKLQTKFI